MLAHMPFEIFLWKLREDKVGKCSFRNLHLKAGKIYLHSTFISFIFVRPYLYPQVAPIWHFNIHLFQIMSLLTYCELALRVQKSCNELGRVSVAFLVNYSTANILNLFLIISVFSMSNISNPSFIVNF